MRDDQIPRQVVRTPRTPLSGVWHLLASTAGRSRNSPSLPQDGGSKPTIASRLGTHTAAGGPRDQNATHAIASPVTGRGLRSLRPPVAAQGLARRVAAARGLPSSRRRAGVSPPSPRRLVLVPSGSGPSFARSPQTERRANGAGLAEDRRADKRCDWAAVAIPAEQHAELDPRRSAASRRGRRVNGWEPTEGRIIAGRRLVSGVGIGAGAAGAVPLIPFTSLRGLFGDCVASGGCGLRSSIATRCAPRPGLFGETG
jgi:hypothetical protein